MPLSLLTLLQDAEDSDGTEEDHVLQHVCSLSQRKTDSTETTHLDTETEEGTGDSQVSPPLRGRG